jgi:ribosomal protein S18 acetylase RimI-like enzyme
VPDFSLAPAYFLYRPLAMPAPEIQPFSEEHLDAAGELLRARHGKQREAEPLLHEKFDFRAEIEALSSQEGAAGTAAFRDGRLVGYLLGTQKDDSWGPNVWVEAAGHAVEEAEDVRDLYAAAAEEWVERGRTKHYALVPATDAELVDAWFRISFGAQHAQGIQEVPDHTDVVVPDGFEIRPPEESEIEDLIEVDLALPRHQRSSPVFSPLPLPSREDERQEWVKTFAGSDEEVLVGYRNGKPVAVWGVTSIERARMHTSLARPEHAAFIGFAATVPEARGSGIGLALTEACFAWAAENGYPTMVTDWRETNLLASRFWPRRGFRRVFLRLHRSIP